jgi:hypothetical protein
MGTRDTYQKVLLKACMVAGDETELARRIDVPVETVVGWLVSEGRLPDEVFLKVVDIVLAANRKQVEDTRAFLEEVKARHPIKAPRA